MINPEEIDNWPVDRRERERIKQSRKKWEPQPKRAMKKIAKRMFFPYDL